MKTFTMKELSQFDGQNGNAVYIAFKGKVYDLSSSEAWEDGNHMASHQAGTDLTAEMDLAPHPEEWLERFPLVGELEKELV